ncbi:MAG: DUF4114 domain-containing protein [Planctomycetota bacterium]|jgi:hypothetical protein
MKIRTEIRFMMKKGSVVLLIFLNNIGCLLKDDKMTKKTLLLIGLCLLLPGSTTMAGPFPPNVANDVYGVAQGGVVNGIPTANDLNDGVPDIFEAINLIQGSALGRNVGADPLFVGVDEVWSDFGGTVALIGLTAGNANTLGVYTDLGIGAAQTPILGPYSGFGFTGDGTVTNPYPAVTTGLGSGTTFGWYLDSSGTDYFSQAALNPNGYDHMMTFDLPGANGTPIYVDYGSGPVQIVLNDPYLLAWEDLPWNGSTLGDDDYDDMMYIVDGVSIIPAPGAMLLASFGVVLTGRLRRGKTF